MTRKIILLALCALALFSCKKAKDEKYNLVVTGDVINLTSTTVTLVGYYERATLNDIQRCGVIGSTDPNPTKENSTLYSACSDGHFVAEYSRDFNELSPGKTYYYRAFMDYRNSIDDEKTIYGEIKSFTTPVSD